MFQEPLWIEESPDAVNQYSCGVGHATTATVRFDSFNGNAQTIKLRNWANVCLRPVFTPYNDSCIHKLLKPWCLQPISALRPLETLRQGDPLRKIHSLGEPSIVEN